MDENKSTTEAGKETPEELSVEQKIAKLQEELVSLKPRYEEAVSKMGSLFQENSEYKKQLHERETQLELAISELKSKQTEPSEVERLQKEYAKAIEDGDQLKAMNVQARLGVMANEMAQMRGMMTMSRQTAIMAGRELPDEARKVFYDKLFVGGDPRGRFISLEAMEKFAGDPEGFIRGVEAEVALDLVKSGEMRKRIIQEHLASEEDRKKKVTGQAGVATGGGDGGPDGGHQDKPKTYTDSFWEGFKKARATVKGPTLPA